MNVIHNEHTLPQRLTLLIEQLKRIQFSSVIHPDGCYIPCFEVSHISQNTLAFEVTGGHLAAKVDWLIKALTGAKLSTNRMLVLARNISLEYYLRAVKHVH